MRGALASDHDHVLLKIDFRNAFNEVSRAAIRVNLLRRGFLALVPYFDARYPLGTGLQEQGAAEEPVTPWPRLRVPMMPGLPPTVLEGRTGVCQGDALGPFFFAMASWICSSRRWSAALVSQSWDVLPSKGRIWMITVWWQRRRTPLPS